MKNNKIPNPDVSVFIKLLDRGFKLSVPADQEKFYREGFEAFMQKMQHHKLKGKGYDDLEAIALASIDCLVALQRNQAETEQFLASFKHRVDALEMRISKSIDK